MNNNNKHNDEYLNPKHCTLVSKSKRNKIGWSDVGVQVCVGSAVVYSEAADGPSTVAVSSLPCDLHTASHLLAL